MIRVQLAIDSPALRAGIKSLLAADEEIQCLDSLDVKNEADVSITSASPDSFYERERESNRAGGILFLNGDPLNIQKMKRFTRVWGILPLDSSAEELIAAIHAIAQGLIVGARPLLFADESEAVQSPLTEREAEVLELLARGLANKQIASALSISEHTVKFHVSSIFVKLNVTNRAEAVREGLRGGWVTL